MLVMVVKRITLRKKRCFSNSQNVAFVLKSWYNCELIQEGPREITALVKRYTMHRKGSLSEKNTTNGSHAARNPSQAKR